MKNSYFWAATDLFGGHAVQIVLMMFLARMISPNEFGIYAIAFSFLSISTFLVDGGLASALIHKNKTSAGEETSVFAANFFVCMIIAGIIYLNAEKISNYYSNEVLRQVLIFGIIIIAIDALSIIHFTLMKRDQRFRELSIITVTTNLASFPITIWYAQNNPTVWALVFHLFITKCIRFLLYLKFSKWRPSRRFDVMNLRSLYAYGINIQLANLANIIYSSAVSLTIGRSISTEVLGFYNRANSIQQIPISGMSTVINRVGFSEMSFRRANGVEINEYFTKSVKYVSHVAVPLMVSIAVGSDFLVHLLLGPGWEKSAELLIYLLIAFSSSPLISVSMNYLKSRGDARIVAQFEVSRYILTFAFFFYYLNYGVETALVSVACISSMFLCISWVVIVRISAISIISVFIAILPSLLIAVLSLLVSFYIVAVFGKQMEELWSNAAMMGLFMIVHGLSIFVFLKISRKSKFNSI